MTVKEEYEKLLAVTQRKHMYVPFYYPKAKQKSMSLRELFWVWDMGITASRMQPSFGFYIHIPFCFQRRCTFCCYRSTVKYTHSTIDSYISRIHSELRAWGPRAFHHYSILYVGGGTPSVLTPAQIEKLLSPFSNFSPSGNCCCTYEMSAATASKPILDVVRRNGFTRVSIGVQTLKDDLLKAINRQSVTLSSIRDMLSYAKYIGFADVNIDLMTGLPGQNEADIIDSICKIVDAGALSVTIYPYAAISGKYKILDPKNFTAAISCNRAAMKTLEVLGWRKKSGVSESSEYIRYFSPEMTSPDMRYQTKTDGFSNTKLIGLGAYAMGFAPSLNYRCASGKLDFDDSEKRYAVDILDVADQKRLAVCCMLNAFNMHIDLDLYERLFAERFDEGFEESVRKIRALGLSIETPNGFGIKYSTRDDAYALMKLFWDVSAITEICESD